MSEGLPKGWASAMLGEVISFALGGDWGKDPAEKDSALATVRVIRGTEYRNWRKEKGSTAAYRRIKKSSLKKRMLQQGDLVLEVSGGGPNQPVGRTLLIDDAALQRADDPLVCSNFCRLLRLSPDIDPSFLNYQLDAAYRSGAFDEFQTETTNLRNLNVPNFLQKTSVALAPLAEQRRIVAKLEALLDKVDACRARLDKIPVILKRFRQSVLAAACSGSLTADWRNTARSSSNHVQDEGTNLPSTWKSYTLKHIANVIAGYAFRSTDFVAAGVPAIKISNVQYGQFVEKSQEYLPVSFLAKYSSFAVHPQSLLMALTRPITNDTLKVCLYPPSARPGLLNQRVCMIDPSPLITRQYLHIFMQTRIFRLQVEANLSETLQPNLSPKSLECFDVVVPPVGEQKEIVRRVEALFAVADAIEARFEKAQAHVEKLTPSLLAKAFRGELVPQDPNDEPASVLLERIRRKQ